ncbi:MAG: hypothetical protein ACSLE6_11110 [Mycobacterium sp.]
MWLTWCVGAALGVLITCLPACGAERSESWQFGHDNADAAISMVMAGVSDESACRSMSGDAEGGVDLNRAEVIQGCLAAVQEGAG